MVDQAFISKFKKPIVLINSSRGAVCSLDAILAGLQSGQLIGLALDVLPNEQIAGWSDAEKARFRAISAFHQTIFSPHVAGWTRESYWKINDALIEKIKAFYQL
jgi:D-3-phosphoglycerate dehydrogenase